MFLFIVFFLSRESGLTAKMEFIGTYDPANNRRDSEIHDELMVFNIGDNSEIIFISLLSIKMVAIYLKLTL